MNGNIPINMQPPIMEYIMLPIRTAIPIMTK